MVIELKYSGTNTYLVLGGRMAASFLMRGQVLFHSFAGCLARRGGATVQEIRYLFISHFYQDHMGIAQEIVDCGVKIVAADVQRAHIHDADRVICKGREPPLPADCG